MTNRKQNWPTQKQLKRLVKRGWIKCGDGLYWQSPYNGCFYAPVMAAIWEQRWGQVK